MMLVIEKNLAPVVFSLAHSHLARTRTQSTRPSFPAPLRGRCFTAKGLSTPPSIGPLNPPCSISARRHDPLLKEFLDQESVI